MSDETPSGTTVETTVETIDGKPVVVRRRIIRRPKTGLGWFVFVLTVLVLLVAMVGLVGRYGVLTPPGRLLIEARTNGLSLGRVGKLRIEGLSGDIWRDFAVRKVTVSDEKGVWLQADNVAVAWRATELFNRRFHATALSAKQVRVIRRPTLTPKGGPSKELPLAFDIDSLKTRVVLEPAFSGQRGDFDLTGDFVAERHGGGAKGAVVAASRLHAGDGLKADFDVGQSNRTRVNIEAVEAQGGALAGSLGLSAKEPFALSAHADGTVQRGAFTIVAREGPQTPLDASGTWAPEGGTAKARILLAASSLMSDNVRKFGPLFELSVTGRRNAQGLQDVTLDTKSDNLIIHASGPVDATKRSTPGMKLDFQVAQMNRLQSFPKLGAGRFLGVLSGPTNAWKVKGQVDIRDTSLVGFQLPSAHGPVEVGYRKGQIDVGVDLTGSGGRGDTILAAWMGVSPHAKVALTRFADHRILVRSIDAKGAGFTLTGDGSRSIFDNFAFKGDIRITNVDAVHHGAKGVLVGGWTAAKGKVDTPWTFDFDGRGSDFATGFTEFDRLLGTTPKLDGRATLNNDLWTFPKLVVNGDKAFIAGVGTMDKAQALKFDLDWRAKGPFHAGPVEIAGDVKGGGTLTGSLTTPRADLTAQIQSIDFPRLTIQPARMVLTFTKMDTGGDGMIRVTGDSPYGQAFGRADFRFREDGLDLTGIDAAAGGVTATGSLALRSNNAPSRADLTLAMGPGAFISGGKATAKVVIVDQPGGSVGTMRMDADNLRFKDSDTLVRSLTVSANGPLAQMPYTASGDISLPQTPVKFTGGGIAAEKAPGWQVSFQGTGRAARADLRTLTPLTVAFGGPETSASGSLAIGAGRADFRASQTDEAVNIDARVQNIDLNTASEDLAGRISGALALSGRGTRLSGTMDANLIDARSRDGPPELAITGAVSGRLDNNRMTLTANATNARGLRSTANVVLPAETSAAPLRVAIVKTRPMTGRFDVDGELQPIWDLFLGGERTLGGHLTAQGTLAGTLNDPRLTGEARLTSGRFEDQPTGLKLTNVTIGADLGADQVVFKEFSGQDGRGGSVSGSGRLSLERGGMSTFALNANRFLLIDNDLGQAQASGAVTVTRSAGGKVKLTGALAIDRADIVAKPLVPSGVTKMEVVEKNRPPGRPDAFEPPKARGPIVELDVRLSAPRRVFLKGQGLDAEMSLDAHVTGTTSKPEISGTARVVRGDYQFASKRFEFDDRGAVYLASSTDRIRLDLSATREDPSLTAVVKIQGTAAKPEIVLTSTPVLPQDEVLSQVLFGRSASQLSAVEAAQVASALGGLASGGGLDILGNLRTFAGLDRLAFAGGSEGSSVAISGGKYITEDVYLELTGGGREGPSAQVEWRVRRTLSIVSRLAGTGDSRLSIRWRKDYGKPAGAK